MPYNSYSFSGADHQNFLQGQLTQDIKKITTEQSSYGAYCNHQGAMFANVLISCDSNSDITLRIHEAQAESVIRRLKMFILRSAVNIELLPVQHFGLNLAATTVVCKSVNLKLPDVFSCVRNDDLMIHSLPGDYFELVIFNNNANQITQLLSEHNDESLFDIESLRINTGNFHIYPETSELLLPQETPLETWGAISYTKGCYVGQEIIARSKYRGKIRKGLAKTTVQSSVINLNSEVFEGDRNVGVVIDIAHKAEQSVCLATLTLSASIDQCTIDDKSTALNFIT